MTAQTAFSGQVSLGAEYLNWTSNYTGTLGGSEFWIPFSLNFKMDQGLSLYGQTEFGNGNYTDPTNGAVNLTNFSDTVVGGELRFKSFELPAILNVGLNLPTGDPTWESKQLTANIPTELLDSRYRGRGFGMSALYGLSFPSGDGEFGAAAGYMYAGAFNPSYAALPVTQLKLGDSVFLSLNHVQPYSGNQSEIIRFSTYFSLPNQASGQNLYQLGTNLNASYSWVNPSALSFELGAQYWMAGQVGDSQGNWSPEAHAYDGPRLYLDPSYSFGDLNIAASFKYVLDNGYSKSDSFFDGGGLLAGVEPSYLLRLDGSSDFKLSVAYDYVAWLDGGVDANNNRTNVIYNLWTFGATYEVKL